MAIVKHVVLAKFKDTVTADQQAALIRDFTNLPNSIPVMKGFEWGTDISIENLNQGYTHVFLVTFDSPEARDEYVNHPIHVAYAKELLAALERVLVVDFNPIVVVPGNAAMFEAYHATKQMLAGGKDTSKLGMGSQILAGGFAGAVFWLSVYPTDVIKSVIQVDDYRNPKYNGTVDAFRKVFAAEGMKGLYRGFGPAMARSVPANAACFVVYELVGKTLA